MTLRLKLKNASQGGQTFKNAVSIFAIVSLEQVVSSLGINCNNAMLWLFVPPCVLFIVSCLKSKNVTVLCNSRTSKMYALNFETLGRIVSAYLYISLPPLTWVVAAFLNTRIWLCYKVGFDECGKYKSCTKTEEYQWNLRARKAQAESQSIGLLILTGDLACLLLMNSFVVRPRVLYVFCGSSWSISRVFPLFFNVSVGLNVFRFSFFTQAMFLQSNEGSRRSSSSLLCLRFVIVLLFVSFLFTGCLSFSAVHWAVSHPFSLCCWVQPRSQGKVLGTRLVEFSFSFSSRCGESVRNALVLPIIFCQTGQGTGVRRSLARRHQRRDRELCHRARQE